jgi:hypothetical protein
VEMMVRFWSDSLELRNYFLSLGFGLGLGLVNFRPSLIVFSAIEGSVPRDFENLHDGIVVRARSASV